MVSNKNTRDGIDKYDDGTIDIDFVVDTSKKNEPYKSPEPEIAGNKKKRYFSAKPDVHFVQKLAKQESRDTIKVLSTKETESRVAEHQDWVLTKTKSPTKPTTKRKQPEDIQPPEKILLFEVYKGGEVNKTQYSTHENALNCNSWNMMHEMLTGKFKDGDFEPTLSNIVGHRKIKTEKDNVKL